MQTFGTNNFFRLMNSLDEEQINPLRGGAISVPASSLQTSIQMLAPSMDRLGIDVATFQNQAAHSLLSLPRAWGDFIRKEAKTILTTDMNRLVESVDVMFENRSLKSSDINSIIHFVLSYYEVIHRRSINKKEVVEGVLMRGLIKKSSFYQKIAVADRDHDGQLSWNSELKQSDDIWRHFTLQTLRFLKQATQELDDLLEDPASLRARIQEKIDEEEFEQFNSGSGRRSTPWMPVILFLVGVGAMLAIPGPSQKAETPAPQVTESLGEPLFSPTMATAMANVNSGTIPLAGNLISPSSVGVPSEALPVGFDQ